MTAYKTAIEKDPRIAQAHFNRGLVLAKQGKLEEAYAACQKVFLLTKDETLISICEKLTKKILNAQSKGLPSLQDASSFADAEADILTVGRRQHDGHVSQLDLLFQAMEPEVEDSIPIKRERDEPPVEETLHTPAYPCSPKAIFCTRISTKPGDN